ncbi:MAG: hypothetical protein Q8M16_08105 [Pirellulaceae bacterium]|nr:hypothetical protein [Pirellulaceae bacterium]
MHLLEYGRGEQLPKRYAGILRFLIGSLTQQELESWLEAFRIYVIGVNQHMSIEDMDRIVQSVFPTQIEPGSIADRLLKQGREEGREEGVVIGKIQTLKELVGDRVSTRKELLVCNLSELEQTLLGLQRRLRQRQ